MISKQAFKTYLVRRQEEVALCRTALTQLNWGTIARVGHKLKGNAETFGLPGLGEIGDCLESSAYRNAPSEVGEALARLERAISAELAKLGQ